MENNIPETYANLGDLLEVRLLVERLIARVEFLQNRVIQLTSQVDVHGRAIGNALEKTGPREWKYEPIRD